MTLKDAIEGSEYIIKDVMNGRKKPIPLILRANAGDWIEVTLYNMFDTNRPIEYFDYPSVPLDYPHKPSDRVSLNPQFLKYDRYSRQVLMWAITKQSRQRVPAKRYGICGMQTRNTEAVL